MKTLHNQTLLYDKDCPLCNAYTSGFISAKFLDSNGRQDYSNFNTENYNFVDMKRAKNEIALIDTKNKKVIYGVDSLLKVVGHSMPWIARIADFKPIKFGLKKLYAFISFNRKVIIPSKAINNQTLQCVPDFNFKYRAIYILLATLITSTVLFQFSKTIGLISESNFLRESFIAIGQIGFQALFLSKLNSEKRVNYIGNLMTISLVGSLILVPILIINSLINLNDFVLLAWFGFTVTYMLFEHIRRIKILDLPSYLSLTWVLYRVIVLIIITNI